MKGKELREVREVKEVVGDMSRGTSQAIIVCTNLYRVIGTRMLYYAKTTLAYGLWTSTTTATVVS